MVDEKRLVIMNKAAGPKYERQFFLDIQEAILKGYRISEKKTVADRSLRLFKGRFGKAVLYPDGYQREPIKNVEEEEIVPSEMVIKKIKEAESRDDLTHIAEVYGLDIGEKLYNPTALRNHLLKQVE